MSVAELQRRGLWLPALALAATLVVCGVYALLGGASYAPLSVRDPCKPRPGVWTNVHGTTAVAQAVALSAADGAACQLDVSRETLTLAVASRANLQAFADAYHLGNQRIEQAVRSGLDRAISDAENADVINGIEAAILRVGLGRLPLQRLLGELRRIDVGW